MSRRFFWLALLIVAAIAAYSAGWFYIAGQLTQRTEAALAALSRAGNRAVCEQPEARGYPFRIGLFCNATFFEDRSTGFSVATGALRSAAQIYAPLHAIVEADGPARISLAGLDPLHVTWDTMRASVRIAEPVPQRVSIVGKGVRVEADTLAARMIGVFTADLIELHMRPNGGELDFAARFNGFRAGEMLSEGRDLPPVSGTLDLSIRDGISRFEQRNAGLRGLSLEIRTLDMQAGNGARVNASGPLSVGEDGLVDGELVLTAANTAALADFLGAAFPDAAKELSSLLPGLSALGERPSLPLHISGGRVVLGFVPLGIIPPL